MAGTSGNFAPGDLCYEAAVTRVDGTIVYCASLAGKGNDYFQGWSMNVVRKANGSGQAPQGDYIPCIGYVSSSGQLSLSRAPNGLPLVAGDIIQMLSPVLLGSLNVVVQPSDDIKQSIDPEVSTIIPAALRTLIFTGVVGSARIKFDMKIDDPLGVAYCVVFKNGVPVVSNPAAAPINYTIWSTALATYATFTQSIGGLVVGDVISLMVSTSGLPRRAYIRNFKICYDIIALPAVQATICSVFFDSINGVPGTAWPIGTVEVPCNNWADTLAIARIRNLTVIQLVHGKITLTDNITGFHFVGNCFSDPLQQYAENCIELNGFIIAASSFEYVNIDNNSTGVPNIGSLSGCGFFKQCPQINVFSISYSYGFIQCGRMIANIIDHCQGFSALAQIIANIISDSYAFENISDIDGNIMIDCYGFGNCGFYFAAMQNVFGMKRCQMLCDTVIDMTGFIPAFQVYELNSSHPLTMINLTEPLADLEFSGDFVFTIAPSCTAGTINVHGNITLVNGSGGTTVNDYTVGGAVSPTRPQKGTQATTNALAVLGAAMVSTTPFKASGLISLALMQAADTFLVTEEMTDQDDATWREFASYAYAGVQASPMVHFTEKVCQGWRIRIQRTAGADRNITYQFFKG